MSRRRRAFVLGALVAIAACVVGALAFIRYQQLDRHNILLISVDTLGAKHMGCYGHFRDTSPHMDALARQGVLFSRAISQSPWTLTSHVSVMTSLYPSTHKVMTERDGLDPAIQTLAEVLRDHGYKTAGFVSYYLVSSHFGLDQGFELYDDKQGWIRRTQALSDITEGGIQRINERVRMWLTEHLSEPFFLFYHVFDVHCPYTPPPPYFNMYSPDYRGSLDLRGKCGNTHLNRMSLSDADVEHIAANYDAGIRYTDEHLGRLFQMLESFGLSNNTIVVLFSDHGEELMEHGWIGHGLTAYDEVLNVPLIIRIPNQPTPGRKTDRLVRLIDVAPTLLDLVGIKPPPSFQGVSLVPLLREGDIARLSAMAKVNRGGRLRHCLYQDGHHFILSTAPRGLELYDVENDPLEQRNLVDKRKALVRDMRNHLLALIRKAKAAGSRYHPRLVTQSMEQAEQLRALGYVD